MGLEFLARVRRSSLILAAVAGLAAATYGGWRSGLALALGVAWSLANLALLERLVVALTGPDRGTPATLRRCAFAACGMALLFGAGGMLLFLLPPMLLTVGFVAPFVVMTLKAASTLLLESRAWRAMTSSPWRAALAVAAVLIAAWWLVPNAFMAPARASDPHAVSSAAPPDTHAATGVAAPSAPGSSQPPGGDRAIGPSPHLPAQQGSGPAHREAHAEGEEKGPQKFANFITVIARAFPDAPWAHWLHQYEIPIFAMLIAALICLVAFLATRNPQMIPGPLQNVVELMVSSLNDFILGILGERQGKRFVPFLGTLFIYIWVMNLFGLIPFMESPTSSLNTTFALAITVFLYVQWVGLRSLGVLGYIDHLMGSPRDVMSWVLVPIMLPIHVLGELAKPISLSCRLFGNIFGEDMLLVAFASLGITVLSALHLPFGLPLQLPFMFLALLTSTLQALVFTVLSTIYLLLMLPHEEHGHEAEAHTTIDHSDHPHPVPAT